MASEPAYESFLRQSFEPGRVHTFVGAGGKTAGMRCVAAALAARGVRVRLTTTTKLGVEEFASFPQYCVRDAESLSRALSREEPILLVSGGTLENQGKHEGLDPALIEALEVPPDVALLVEGDGARHMPVKAPFPHEPVIPGNSATVFALMGASAFDAPVDAKSCYNPGGILALLGQRSAVLSAPALFVLAGHPLGSRKGVSEGMRFHLLVNQADLEGKRATARALVRECREHGIAATLLSWREGRVYDAS